MKNREGTLEGPGVQGRGFVSTPLRKASKHVSDLWFPVNEALLGQIKSALREGMFNSDIKALVEEVSGDFSLFLYCVRELVAMIREQEPEVELPPGLSPGRLLEWGGVDRLRKILDVEPSDISAHSLKNVSDLQVSRFQEAMISATASESLATSYSIDPDLAYSAGLLRQLGYTLIAWNYPVVYQKAVAQLASNVPLDVSLTQMFGFSPALLAINVVRKWELPTPLYQSLIDDVEELEEGEAWTEDDEVRAISETIARICKTGEALARANNPKQYPTAQNDWEFARVEIERALGPEGMKIIHENLKENCQRYTDLAPHLFSPAFILDPEAAIVDSRKDEVLKRNPYIDQCRPFLRKKLLSFYENLRAFEVSRESLNLLAKDIIPSSGFAEGAVFTVDPATQMLVPQLAVGKCSLKRFPAVGYDPSLVTNEEVGEHIVSEAFKGGNPVVRQLLPEGELVMVAGALGFSHRIGVLYLETRRLMFENQEAQQLIHFKALSQAFNDCLGLK